MIIGEIFRYSRPYSASPAFVDELPNYFAHTQTSGAKMALLEAGINPSRVFVTTEPRALLEGLTQAVGVSRIPRAENVLHLAPRTVYGVEIDTGEIIMPT